MQCRTIIYNAIYYRFWLFSVALHFIRDIYELWKIVSLEMKLRSQCRTLSNPNQHIMSLTSHCTAATSYGYNYLHEDIFAIFGPVTRWSLDHKEVVLDTLKNGCDLVIPLTGLGYVKASPGITGLCGMISSLIGIITIIDPLARIQPS